MIYITGDTRGKFGRFKKLCKEVQPTTDDIMIILGEAAFNYAQNKHDEERKTYMNSRGITVFSIHGNHEMHPTDVLLSTSQPKCSCPALIRARLTRARKSGSAKLRRSQTIKMVLRSFPHYQEN